MDVNVSSTQSEFNVEVVRITALEPVPNADKLLLAKFDPPGPPVLVRKGDFAPGDRGVFIPLDAVVPLDNPAFAFLGAGHSRIRAVRMRGSYSEGLLVPVSPCLDKSPGLNGGYIPGTNVADALGVKKYVSPSDLKADRLPAVPGSGRELQRKADSFMPVYGVDSALRFPTAITPGTPVVVTEKIHGCNARFSYSYGRLWVASHRQLKGRTSGAFTLAAAQAWHWVKRLFRRGPPLLGGAGSSVWWDIAKEYQLADRLKAHCPGLVVYGEIFGSGLQKRGGISFDYGVVGGNHGFVVFDIYDPGTKTYLPWSAMQAKCDLMGLPSVPLYDRGAGFDAETTWKRASGISALGNHIREGVVVRTDVDTANKDRVVLKFVSPEYKLLSDPNDSPEAL